MINVFKCKIIKLFYLFKFILINKAIQVLRMFFAVLVQVSPVISYESCQILIIQVTETFTRTLISRNNYLTSTTRDFFKNQTSPLIWKQDHFSIWKKCFMVSILLPYFQVDLKALSNIISLQNCLNIYSIESNKLQSTISLRNLTLVIVGTQSFIIPNSLNLLSLQFSRPLQKCCCEIFQAVNSFSYCSAIRKK